jgi:predicted amidohydrolase
MIAMADRPLRICCAQISGFWDDPKKTLEKAGLFVRHAAASGSSFVCFPEQFATGWDPGSGSHAESSDGSIVSELRDLARKNHIGILGSFREKNDPLPKNTAVAIGPDGEILATYAKMHLFRPGGEDRGFFAGSYLGIFRIEGFTCGIAICYDLRFPELFRLYARNGVQAVFVPAAWPTGRMKHWELFITARACENQMYIIGINTTGKTPVDTYAGGSITVNPSGQIICRATEAEQLLFADINLAHVAATRSAFPVMKDCRYDLYSELSARTPDSR